MCVRRWRPGDRCVSFHHYLQGSPGEPGVPGNDGLKGEKVGKLQIKSLPESKEKWSYDVLLQVQHARQLAKMPFRLLALRPILSHCVTLCSCLRCLSLLCFCTQMFFLLLAVIFQTLCWKWQTRKVEKCAADMHIWWGLLLVRKNEDALNSPHPPESLCYSPEQRNRPRVLKPPIFIHIKCLSLVFSIV